MVRVRVGLSKISVVPPGRNMDLHAELDALLRLPHLDAARGGEAK